MKSKKITTYLLLAASMVIWGTIAWKLAKAFKKDEIVVQKAPTRPVINKPDSVVLLLNYDDPFLKGIEGKTLLKEEGVETCQDNLETDFFPQEPEVVQGPAFKFKGILKAGKKTYGLLDLRGETIMSSPREKIGNFYIVSITSDKLVVRWQGQDMELFAE
ncbi:MAG: hypothetical protein LBT43_03310 [Prevotella sp.]|jgi:hypothetical protein|nr:hypothetical protein [Prevotella sp.]